MPTVEDMALWAETGIHPTQDGGVIVLLAGVAEVLTRSEAMNRLSYVLNRHEIAEKVAESIDHQNGHQERSIDLVVQETRIRAYRTALHYGAKK